METRGRRAIAAGDQAVAGDLGEAEALLTAWEHFTALVATPKGRAFVATPDAVEALIGRSALQKLVEEAAVDRARLKIADRAFKKAAPELWSATGIALYAADEPAQAWWWHAGAPTPLGEQLLDVRAAAEVKGVHEHTIRGAIHRGELRARRLGRGFLLQRSDLLAWTPRGVGRPRRAAAPDDLLDEFMSAAREQNLPRAHAVARTLEQQPTTAARAVAVAVDLFSQERFQDVLEWIARARGIGLEKKVAGATSVLRGLTLRQLGRHEESLAEFQVATQALPDDPEPIGHLATAMWDAGRGEEADELVRNALARLGDPGELEYLLARRCFSADRVARAHRHVVRFRIAHADHRGAMALEGAILGYLGDSTGDPTNFEEASDLLSGAATGPTDPVRRLLGFALSRLGRWGEAIDVASGLGRDTEEARDVARASLFGALHSAGLEPGFEAARLVEARLGPSALTRGLLGLEAALAGRTQEARVLLSESYRPGGFATDEEAAISTMAWIAAGQPGAAVSLLRSQLAGPDPSPNLLVLAGRAAIEAEDTSTVRDALERLASTDESQLGQLAQIALELLHKENVATPVTGFAIAALAPRAGWHLGAAGLPVIEAHELLH